jgi:hypothetical protein
MERIILQMPVLDPERSAVLLVRGLLKDTEEEAAKQGNVVFSLPHMRHIVLETVVEIAYERVQKNCQRQIPGIAREMNKVVRVLERMKKSRKTREALLSREYEPFVASDVRLSSLDSNLYFANL